MANSRCSLRSADCPQLCVDAETAIRLGALRRSLLRGFSSGPFGCRFLGELFFAVLFFAAVFFAVLFFAAVFFTAVFFAAVFFVVAPCFLVAIMFETE